ncbi:hypothetical protein [Nocardioides sp.]|uniref:hypothetical protein n=1 Tax=Nocardioides sp. TaxID=35761 RepID=UPI003516658C
MNLLPQRRRAGLPVLALLLTALAAPAATSPAGAVSSAVVDRAAKPTLTAPAEVDAGEKVRLKGTAPAGSTVLVQRRQGSRWAALGRTTASKAGRWSTTVRFPGAGTVTTRAVAAGTPSKVRRVVVYAWLDLASQPAIMTTSNRDLPLVLGGRTYPHSVISLDSSSLTAVWRIDRRCTDLRYSFGFEDADRAKGDPTDRMLTLASGYAPDDSVAATSGERSTDLDTTARVALAGLRTSDRLAILYGTDDSDDDGLATLMASPQVRCSVAALGPIATADLPPFGG